jgi:hypothetical protein
LYLYLPHFAPNLVIVVNSKSKKINSKIGLIKRTEIIIVSAIILIIAGYITYQFTLNSPMYIGYIRTEESKGNYFYIYGYHNKKYDNIRDLKRQDLVYMESLRHDAKEFNWISSGYNDKNEMMPVFLEYHDDSTRSILNDEFAKNNIHLFYSNTFYNRSEEKNFTLHSFYIGSPDSIEFINHRIKRDSIIQTFGY